MDENNQYGFQGDFANDADDNGIVQSSFLQHVQSQNQPEEENGAIPLNDEDPDGGKKKGLIIAIVIALIALIGLGTFIVISGKDKKKSNDKKEVVKKTETKAPEATEEPEPTEEPTEEPSGDEVPEGMARSRLTGEIIPEDQAKKRPYAAMLSNIKVASPQSGISEADILFECVVEGGITRFMGIFGDITTDRLGSLRSARPYYASFAHDFDAMYIHVGGSDDGKAKIKNLGVADLEADSLIYRDKSLKAPHNAFASKSSIEKTVTKKKFRTDYEGPAENYFKFNTADTEPAGVDANKVTIKFSSYTTPYLTYNADDKLYYRYQFGSAHKDANTSEQLKFKNIVIMYVKEWSYDGADRQEMDIYDSTGSGKYISDGKAVDVKWTRNESSGICKFTDANGEMISVNVGKTYIAVVPDTMQSATKIEAQ